MLDVATDPFATVAAAAKECGFPEATLKQLLKRMRTRYKPFNDALREVKRDELIKILEDRALRCIEYVDDFAMAKASLRDLAITAGVLIDKSLLLKGEPTAIFRNEDRRKLNELLPALIAEAKRRGVNIIDVTPVD